MTLKIEQVAFRLGLSVLIGVLIGMERARHGRAAGMRTHVLVCLGATITAMTGIFTQQVYGGGDITRLAAQVVSGVGFLGAGMIILKNDNMITGLTTAAGVWATATLGIAVGYGFYSAALIAAALFLITLMLFSKFERRKKNTEVVYLEISDMTRVNELMEAIRDEMSQEPVFRVIPPKSGCTGHIGLELVMDRRKALAVESFLDFESVIFALEV
jgi:putative Mg2+ transporter-C (MgtC) family protein